MEEKPVEDFGKKKPETLTEYALVRIAKRLKHMDSEVNQIKKWVTFMGVMLIVAIVMSLAAIAQ